MFEIHVSLSTFDDMACGCSGAECRADGEWLMRGTWSMCKKYQEAMQKWHLFMEMRAKVQSRHDLLQQQL